MNHSKSVYVGTYRRETLLLERGEEDSPVQVKNLIDPLFDGQRVRVTVELLGESGIVEEALEKIEAGPHFKRPTEEDHGNGD